MNIDNNKKQMTAVVVGAGDRGARAYASYALSHPEDFKIVAVAEPNEARRHMLMKDHGIPTEMGFASWEEMMAADQPQLADAAMICTLDQQHYEPTKAALEKGYHILLEKPLSNDVTECAKLGQLADQYPERVFSICHVLRYTNFYQKLKEVIDSKMIGDIMNINHSEIVGHIHQSHSFVRGNWGNSKKESPMILQKCCHDMDILHWMVGSECEEISSFGSLDYFNENNAPAGGPARCLDGCPVAEDCPYDVHKIYLTEDTGWPTSVISPDTSYDARVKALQEGPYGKCVFRTDNDVVDHQVVNMRFKNNITAHLTMTAFGVPGRYTYIHGTKGQISASFDENIIEVQRLPEGEKTTYHVEAVGYGHGGGDENLMRNYVELLRANGQAFDLTNCQTSVHSHMMSFAAEKSRVTGQNVNLKDYIAETLK